MKTLLTLAILAATSISSFAASGKVAPYTYDYNGSPVDAPTSSINPPPGSTVIDASTGTRYRKVSPVDDNSSYAVDAIQVVSASTPVTTGTVTANALSSDEILYITPAGTIAALTFAFPSNASSHIGQAETLLSTQIVTALTLTGTTGQTINGTAATALAANVPVRWIKTADATWTRISSIITDSGVVLEAPVVTDGLTAAGSAANTFAGSSGTFLTSTGANTLNGAVTVNAATTPSLTTAAGKTNTGFVQINGKTSGAIKVIPADASAYTITLTNTAQTVGTTTLTIPDFANVSDTFAFIGLAQTLTNKTLTSPVLGGTETGTVTDATTRTITGTDTVSTTGAIIFSGTAHPAKSVIVTGTSMDIYLTGSTGLRISGTTVTTF